MCITLWDVCGYDSIDISIMLSPCPTIVIQRPIHMSIIYRVPTHHPPEVPLLQRPPRLRIVTRPVPLWLKPVPLLLRRQWLVARQATPTQQRGQWVLQVCLTRYNSCSTLSRDPRRASDRSNNTIRRKRAVSVCVCVCVCVCVLCVCVCVCMCVCVCVCVQCVCVCVQRMTDWLSHRWADEVLGTNKTRVPQLCTD